MLCNKNLHEIRGPNDRGAHGECIRCIADRSKRASVARSEALRFCRELSAAGIPLDVHLIAATFRQAAP